MGTDDFYEAQSRLDGAFCQITEADKFAFLNEAYNKVQLEISCLLHCQKCERVKGTDLMFGQTLSNQSVQSVNESDMPTGTD